MLMLKVIIIIDVFFSILIKSFIVYALYNMAYSLGMLIGPMVAGIIMSEQILKPNEFQVLMLIFSGVILITCPIILF